MEVVIAGTEHAAFHRTRSIGSSAPLDVIVAEPRIDSPAKAVHGDRLAPASLTPPPRLRQLLIVGVTKDGKAFRPSDWSERLASAMSAFRPAAAQRDMASFIGYSPYCVPRTVAGQKCVLVDEGLRGIEVLAWDFVMHFARDNELEIRDVTPAPGQPATHTRA